MARVQKHASFPVDPAALEAIAAYLEAAGHGEDRKSVLFRPVRNNRAGTLGNGISGDGVYRMVKAYAASAGVHVDRLWPPRIARDGGDQRPRA